MRIRIVLNDSRILTWGGRPRYAAFRLTREGGYVVTSGPSAKDVVSFAKGKYRERGTTHLVMDTVTGEAIALYPYKIECLPKGQTDVRFK